MSEVCILTSAVLVIVNFMIIVSETCVKCNRVVVTVNRKMDLWISGAVEYIIQSTIGLMQKHPSHCQAYTLVSQIDRALQYISEQNDTLKALFKRIVLLLLIINYDNV